MPVLLKPVINFLLSFNDSLVVAAGSDLTDVPWNHAKLADGGYGNKDRFFWVGVVLDRHQDLPGRTRC